MVIIKITIFINLRRIVMSPDAIFTRYNLSVSQTRLRRWLGSQDAADEAIQTVGEKLLRSGAKPSPAYLFAMFRSAAVDTFRAETTRREYEAEYALQAETVDHQTPERRLAGVKAVEALQSAIAELSPVNREIFLRAYVDDQPRAEIAAALGLRLSTVEKRLARARRHCLAQTRPYLDGS